MKILYNDYFITDNSNECDSRSYFFISSQNAKFLEDAKKKDIKGIINSKELQNLFKITDIKIVGVTGTNGKTTTTAAIYSFLIDLGYSVALQGTRGFFINEKRVENKSLTTPSLFETLLHLKKAKEENCDFFIMEVSSHALAQGRIEGLRYDLKLFTNISQDHLDYHKTMEEYKRVKSSFFMNDSKKLINKDGGNIKFNIKNSMSYSLEYPATYKIDAFSLQKGIKAVLKHFNNHIEFNSPMMGLFNLYNITAAFAATHIVTKKSLKEIAEVVENFAGVSGRMEVVNENPLVIVDFAHTPDGMKKVLDSIKGKNISVVFGAGGDRDKGKRAMMGRVASEFATKIYVTSDNPRGEDPLEIIKDIVEGIDNPNTLIIPDREQAIKKAVKELQKDEVLFILGKGDEEYQEINGQKIPFSDKEVVAKILQ